MIKHYTYGNGDNWTYNYYRDENNIKHKEFKSYYNKKLNKHVFYKNGMFEGEFLDYISYF